MATRSGILTISLDFELFWGTRDHRSLATYGPRVEGGRTAIPRILDLFAEFGVHATWATVGFVLFEGPDELSPSVPKVLPDYADARLSPYPEISSIGTAQRPRDYFFGPELIERIRRTPFQELGSHTFSHYYCLEPGQSAEAFAADLEAMRATARTKLDVEMRSLVFPRNQANHSYLGLCREAGIHAYRGNPRSWVYDPKKQSDETLVRRGLRLVDSYVNLTGHHGHALRDLPVSPLVDVPASRFLRPYASSLRALEPLRLRRIERDLSHAAERGLLYHLWWHPENFGKHTRENLAFLRKVLEHYRRLAERDQLQSLAMGEVADLVRSAA